MLVHAHDAHARGLGHGDLLHGNGAGRVVLLMGAQHLGVVHFIDVVAGEDQHVVRIVHLDESNVLIDGVGRAGEPGALFMGAQVGRQDVHAAVGHVKVPGLSVADVAVELQGAVLGQNTNGVNARVCAVT